jgi:hypothetical protein
MSCIVNINRFIIPNDIISTITNIYKYIGKNDIYEQTVGNDINRIIEQTVGKDCYYIARILSLDISDNRMRLIVTKNSSPRTKDETTLYRIKEVLTMIQMKHQDLTTQSNDLINIANYINPNQNIKYAYQEENKKVILKSQSMRSKRLLLDEINDISNNILAKQSFEQIILNLHFFIDFYNLKPFSEENETTAFLLLYLLLLKAEVYCFKYVSFFETLYNSYDRFEVELKNASFNWNEGFAQTLGFVRFFTKLIFDAYLNTEDRKYNIQAPKYIYKRRDKSYSSIS